MACRSWDDPWHQYPESRPLPAVDGIATSKQRGRRYARSGQVLSLAVTPGLVVAQVQGSRRTPYLVSIRAAVPSAKAWTKLQDALQAKIGFVARLSRRP
jgi:uncharacterized Zn finger protein